MDKSSKSGFIKNVKIHPVKGVVKTPHVFPILTLLIGSELGDALQTVQRSCQC